MSAVMPSAIGREAPPHLALSRRHPRAGRHVPFFIMMGGTEMVLLKQSS